MRVYICILALIFTVTACPIYRPHSAVNIKESRPSLVVKGASVQAILMVDGLNMGPASRYDGVDEMLLVEPGRHHIEIVDGGNTVLEQEVLLVDEQTKTLLVGSN